MSTKELWIVMSESDGETDAIAVNGKYAAQDISVSMWRTSSDMGMTEKPLMVYLLHPMGTLVSR